jgi:hypothetical protein
MSRFDFHIFDAGNHLYEAEDALTRHLPTAYKDVSANMYEMLSLAPAR